MEDRFITSLCVVSQAPGVIVNALAVRHEKSLPNFEITVSPVFLSFISPVEFTHYPHPWRITRVLQAFARFLSSQIVNTRLLSYDKTT